MTRSTKQLENDPLEALQSLVAHHGDAFRYSISKRGRIWLTLTHWDTQKYNTSVELDALSGISDWRNGLWVVCAAHALKCFRTGTHTDTWLSIEATQDSVDDAISTCRSILSSVQTATNPNVDKTTATGQERDKTTS